MAVVGKKKQDEINLKTLRELTSLDHNKKCLECGQRGITYADMTTAGFVCVQCSGYLRGINPPHRVKSISMTSFSEKEIGQLKKGGNEVSRKIWLGNWDPSKDREPDKKKEFGYKEFLISKYERKQWYKSPPEVKKEATPVQETKVETKLQPPPPSTKTQQAGTTRPHVGSAPIIIQTCTAPSEPTPTPSVTVATPTTQSAPFDLLGGLGRDPFAPKKPVGAVSVMVGVGGAPLIPSNTVNGSVKPEEFGAFTGASVSTSLSLQPSTASSATNSTGDKYAELASLDSTFRELRVKDEPSPLLAQTTPPQSQASAQPFSGNPFVSPASSQGVHAGGMLVGAQQPQSNPFVASGQPQGGQFGGGFAQPQMQGGGFQSGQMQGGFPQQQHQQQGQVQGQGFPQQQQQQGQQQVVGFPQQQGHVQGQGQMQRGFPQQQQQVVVFPQQQQQQQGQGQRQGQGFPQQQQQGQIQGQGFPQQQQGQMQQQQRQPNQFGQPPSQWQQQQQHQPQTFGGVQQAGWGSAQQVQPLGGGVPQQQWGAQVSPQGTQFGGGVQQGGGFGGGGVQQGGGFGGMQPQQQIQGQQFGLTQQAVQQQQQQKPAQQFDWSGVNMGKPQPAKKKIDWSGGIPRVDYYGVFANQTPLSCSTSSTSITSSEGSLTNFGVGWSTELTKPVSSSDSQEQQLQQLQQQPQQPQITKTPMGWSTNVMNRFGRGKHSNSIHPAGPNFGQASGGGVDQQEQQMSGHGGGNVESFGGANPFAPPVSQSGPTNPFL